MMSLMSCSISSESPSLNPAFLPGFALFSGDETPGIGWELSPTPFSLTQGQYKTLESLGQTLLTFSHALNELYRQSTTGKQPAWIADWLDRGKPDGLLKFAQMKRFKQDVPLVIRPDLLITEDGFALTEIDSVPGGIGFTSALNAAYAQSGFSVIGSDMPQAFLQTLKTWSQLENPVIATVVSDEAQDYRSELAWLVKTLQPTYPHIALVHPKQLDIVRDRLVMTDDAGTETPIDLIYRFFELFDLPNIPKIELIQYAIKKQWVLCTPPWKPHLEEKLALALVHHPMLASYWESRLGDEFSVLKQLVPPTWVMDPTPLPPQAVITGLSFSGQPLQSFEALKSLSQKERQLVLKPSGFSPLAWGSRGVNIGHDMPQTEWAEAVETALSSYPQTPWILQPFQSPKRQTIARLDAATGKAQPFQARTRLCPYYFVAGDQAQLAGVLATSCPADKKIIHGMRDAILSPCMAEGMVEA